MSIDLGPLFNAGAEAGMVIAEKRAASEIAALKAEVERLRAWAEDEQQKREAVEEDRLRERQENDRLRGIFAGLRTVWFGGVDLDKDAISQATLGAIIEAERVVQQIGRKP